MTDQKRPDPDRYALTTDAVMAALEKLRDLSLMSGLEGSYYRQAFAVVEAELTRLRADLAALVPLARWVVAPVPAAPTSSEQYAAARAVLASVEARIG